MGSLVMNTVLRPRPYNTLFSLITKWLIYNQGPRPAGRRLRLQLDLRLRRGDKLRPRGWLHSRLQGRLRLGDRLMIRPRVVLGSVSWMEDGRVAWVTTSSCGIVSPSVLWFVIGLWEEGPGKNKLGSDLSCGTIGSVASVTTGPKPLWFLIVWPLSDHGSPCRCRKVRS